MIKFSISYFYMIRFFKPNQIPVSTALSDPDWYHDFQPSPHSFLDKRGVYNGIRSPILNPRTSECAECNCKTLNCLFKQNYAKQLDGIDFWWYYAELEKEIYFLANQLNIEDPEIVLIVHEAPNNPCSEREVLQEWFRKHNVELDEFEKPKQATKLKKSKNIELLKGDL